MISKTHAKLVGARDVLLEMIVKPMWLQDIPCTS